jgi:hypothetical protein
MRIINGVVYEGEDWTALYLPWSPEGDQLSRSAFPSEEAAWQYAYSHMCEGCQKARRNWEAGMKKDPTKTYDTEVQEYPACVHEWEVLLTSELAADPDAIAYAQESGTNLIPPPIDRE